MGEWIEMTQFLIAFSEVVSINFVLGMVHPFYIGMIFIIFMMYRKNVYLEENILGDARSRINMLVFESTMHGILAGLIVSLLVHWLGIHIQMEQHFFISLWLILLMISLLNMRYLCFAYGAGILGLCHLLFGWPNMDVSGLLAIVALLHLAEAGLIWGDGSRNAIPMFVEHKGKVVGSFVMHKQWPIPLVLLIVSMVAEGGLLSNTQHITEPHWWPLMSLQGNIISHEALYKMLPIPAILGYSEMVITDSPRGRTRKSALFIAIYSLLLLGLALLSATTHIFKYIAVFFAIIGHGLLTLYWTKKERNGKAYFSVPPQGVRVLDIIEGGPAFDMGIAPGDVILRINNKQVMTRHGIKSILSDYPTFIWVDILRENKHHFTFEYKCFPKGIDNFKILIVPRDENVANVQRPSMSYHLLRKLIGGKNKN